MNNVWSKSFIKACSPKTKLTGSEWADTHGIIPPPAAEAGKWRTSRTPYLKEILDTAADRETRHIVFIAGSQIGKTAAILQILGFYIHQSPTAVMVVQPTLDAAKLFSKTRVDPMIKYSRALSPLIERSDGNNSSSKRETSTILTKNFNGGFCDMVGSNSPTGLASKAIKVLLLDEIDRYPDSAGKEGDPVELAIQRTATFHDKKIFAVSTPTNKYTSKIDNMFELSDKRYFFLPCKSCGGYQHLDWYKHVRWDKDGDGIGIPKTARIECEFCGSIMRDNNQPTKNFYDGGEWRATEESKIAGFHVNSLYSPFWRLDDLVEKWLKVVLTKDQEKIKTFVNLQFGLAWEDRTEQVDYETIEKNRRTTYDAELHDKILCLTASVDTQDTWLEAEIRGWSHGNETFGVEHRLFYGDPAQSEVWDQLDEWLQRPRYFKDGSSLTPSITVVDSGGHYTDEVYRFCKAREMRKVFAIKGSSQNDAPIIKQPSMVGQNKDTYLFLIGTNTGKQRVYSALKNEAHGPLYCHFPRENGKGYDDEYFKGLMAEKYVHEFKNGVASAKWKKVYERNEPLDLFVYHFAALEILKPPYDELQKIRDNSVVTVNKPIIESYDKPRVQGRRLSSGVKL